MKKLEKIEQQLKFNDRRAEFWEQFRVVPTEVEVMHYWEVTEAVI